LPRAALHDLDPVFTPFTRSRKARAPSRAHVRPSFFLA
jgi:hypothetical protein